MVLWRTLHPMNLIILDEFRDIGAVAIGFPSLQPGVVQARWTDSCTNYSKPSPCCSESANCGDQSAPFQTLDPPVLPATSTVGLYCLIALSLTRSVIVVPGHKPPWRLCAYWHDHSIRSGIELSFPVPRVTDTRRACWQLVSVADHRVCRPRCGAWRSAAMATSW
jgi:hypothetical protein